MPSHPTLPDIKIISIATLKILADPLRARLLGMFASTPATVQELAAQLHVPVTRLYYHIHKMEAHGLVQVISTHPTGGTVEKVYYASARQFIVDRREFAVSSGKALQQAEVLINYALAETGKAIRKGVKNRVIDLSQTAPHPQALFIRRGSGRLTPTQAKQFYQRLEALIEEFTSIETGHNEQAEYLLATAFFPTTFNNKE